jgi:hypothetical protein
VTKKMVARQFGTYTRGLEASGLVRQDKARPHSMMELFLMWATVARKVNRIPSIADFKIETSISEGCVIRRFRKWGLAPMGMLRFMEQQKLEAEFSDVAELIRVHLSAPPTGPSRRPLVTFDQPGGALAGPMQGLLPDLAIEPIRDRPLYGAPIINPAMANAPTNEMGVMVLFGSLAPQLGFIVIRVQAAFPDAEVLRRTKDGRCQRALFEFEFESKNFMLHMHDPQGCDGIVCWIHNWKECPLEVIELSRIVGIPGDRA